MSQLTTGRAALVANNLPTAKTITAATNAPQIVITTSAAHGVKPNEIISISGVTGNTAANGTFVAGAVTSTTIALTAYPGGTNVAGSGAYVSGGTLQSLGFGLTVPVPNDLTDPKQAATVNIPMEALLDFTAYLMQQAGPHSALQGDVDTLKFTIPSFDDQQTTLTLVAIGGSPLETLTGASAKSTIALVDFSGAVAGDVVNVWCAFDIATYAAGVVEMKLYATEDYGGGSATDRSPLGGVAEFAGLGAATEGPRTRLVLTAKHTVITPGPLRVGVQMTSGVGDQLKNYGSGTIHATKRHLGP